MRAFDYRVCVRVQFKRGSKYGCNYMNSWVRNSYSYAKNVCITVKYTLTSQ